MSVRDDPLQTGLETLADLRYTPERTDDKVRVRDFAGLPGTDLWLDYDGAVRCVWLKALAVSNIQSLPATLPTCCLSIQRDTYFARFEWFADRGELWCCGYVPVAESGLDAQFFKLVLGNLENVLRRDIPALRASVAEATRTGKPGSAPRETLPEDSGRRIRNAASLDSLGRDLVRLAATGDILPMYVREEILRKMIAVLSGPHKHVLLVGEPGTGKNALVHALATWIARDDVCLRGAAVRGRHIYECTPTSFQVGCLYVNDLANKIRLVVENCIAENAILFLDEINLAVGAGSYTDDPDRTVANILLPFLERREITVIGAATPSGHEAMMRANPRFGQRFHVVNVPESDLEETRRIVDHRVETLASGHGTSRQYQFAPHIADTVIEVSERFFPSRKFPGKVLELLNEVVALHAMRPEGGAIRPEDVYLAVRERTGLTEDIVLPSRALSIRQVADALGADVLGQDRAVQAVAEVVVEFKAEMEPRGRPVAAFLFVGPTGVGKTQLARTLTRYLFGTEEPLLRYDMTEFAGQDALYKLCGMSGRMERPGRLVGDITARPFSVVLFDEVEKAHSDVFDALLQVLGEGRMTDETGRTASFVNSIIIMTSNIGAEVYQRPAAGFDLGARNADVEQVTKAIREHFRPEFVGRISRIVHFQRLDRDIVRSIASREVAAFGVRRGLAKREIALEVSPAMLEEIVRQGYDDREGARAMQKAVERILAPVVSDWLASHPLEANRTLTVDWGHDTAVVRAQEVVVAERSGDKMDRA